jgi:hypothetical protein
MLFAIAFLILALTFAGVIAAFEVMAVELTFA